MTQRWALLLVPILAGCGSTLTRAKVTITFENETQTQCVKVFAKPVAGGSTSNSGAVDRKGKDTLFIGISETTELTGELEVTVSRFAAMGCMGTAFDSQTRNVTLMKPGMTGMLEFHFVGMTDGGVDGGVDGGPTDGGGDGGCDTSGCRAAGDCETGLPSCSCTYARADAGTPCSMGVCASSGACVANVCAALPPFSACDAGLSCVSNAQCTSNMLCLGNCPGPRPQCRDWDNTTCATATECASVPRPSADGTNCDAGVGAGQCLTGTCFPWFTTPPTSVHVGLADVVYPDAGWLFTSTDGGVCDTIISTSGTPSVVLADCGAPPLFTVIDDAGVAVFTTNGLTVGPLARVHFVGSRPAQVLILGDATINGVFAAAPILPGFMPAGSQPASCSIFQNANANSEGGGGGGYGGNGGAGGQNGPNGGAANASSSVVELRGGCAGGAGFKAGSGIDGGTGGGALELAATGTITISGGAVSVSGAGGSAGGPSDNEGGGGGGSGGTVIIDARVIVITMDGGVTSNGGGGGEGGDTGNSGCLPGEDGSLNRGVQANASAPNGCSGGPGGTGGASIQVNGGAGTGASRGGGGGGGAAGVVFLNGRQSCSRTGGTFSGATPVNFTCN